ncbi:hypothetical protein [Pseudonocardia nigra]|uniref:hypothetical protein n=1 Tax=Pseudonocardia nigra TaxID=1921578 RepID=UPI001C5F834E|nr:hypothetical protein [Pseudonocardia nigra]
MSTGRKHERDDRPEAVRQADRGARTWRAVVHAQRTATPDHADFYALAGEVVDTLASLEALARVLTRQVDRYAEQSVYDDSGTVDPFERLADAADESEALARALYGAGRHANRFWSAIGHIGVRDAGEPGATSGPGGAR